LSDYRSFCFLVFGRGRCPGDVIINPNANILPLETYTADPNLTNGVDQTRAVESRVAPELAKLVASDGYSGDEFGHSVAISGNYAIVGAYHDDDDGESSGSAYIFERSGSGWVEQAKLTASDGTAGDWFGYSVAISGDYAIVGAFFDDAKGSSSGSAYIFERSSSGWVEQAKLTASDGYQSDYFGRSVAINGDYAIVGAYYDDDNGSCSGSAYIFERSGSGWVEQAKLTASDGYNYDYFGYSVALSGNYAIFGAYGDDDDGSYSGSAYVFEEACPSIELPLKFTPQTLNTFSQGKWVKAHMVLPAEYALEDVDCNSPAVLEPLGIESSYMDAFINEDDLVEVEITFDRATVCDQLQEPGPFEITVTAKFTNGQCFCGTDTITIINNHLEVLAILSSNWMSANCRKPQWCAGADLNQDSVVNLFDFVTINAGSGP